MGAFSLKISIAPSGETIARIKKVRWGCKKNVQSSSITMPSMVWIVGCVPAVDKKSAIFLSVCLSRFGIARFIIPRYYCSSYFHYRGKSAVTVVLPLSPLPCRSLIQREKIVPPKLPLLLRFFVLCHVKSDFDETWYEWYNEQRATKFPR